MCEIAGVGEILDPDHVKSALQSIYRYNFMPSLRFHFNPCRIYGLNDESGLTICSWPENVRKPVVPIPYSEECMHGFEYELAGLWAAHGQVDRAITAVRAVRDRYDGVKRNPYNEIECGNNYARAMASFAMLPILSGMEFDMSRGYLGFSPVVQTRPFACLFSIGHCWGNYALDEEGCALCLQEGDCTLQSFGLPEGARPDRVLLDGKEIAYTFENGVIRFAEQTFRQSLKVYFVK
jgi:hypothetical protein